MGEPLGPELFEGAQWALDGDDSTRVVAVAGDMVLDPAAAVTLESGRKSVDRI